LAGSPVGWLLWRIYGDGYWHGKGTLAPEADARADEQDRGTFRGDVPGYTESKTQRGNFTREAF
ncbi:MAG: hypothetical protein KDA60_16015, partial [Planctomycetales bacterium]|nr:hypothetical protein [Planctomycetales bacterium]